MMGILKSKPSSGIYQNDIYPNYYDLLAELFNYFNHGGAPVRFFLDKLEINNVISMVDGNDIRMEAGIRVIQKYPRAGNPSISNSESLSVSISASPSPTASPTELDLINELLGDGNFYKKEDFRGMSNYQRTKAENKDTYKIWVKAFINILKIQLDAIAMTDIDRQRVYELLEGMENAG